MQTHSETPETSALISPHGRGGIWLAVVVAAIFVGVIWSGIFAGSNGIYGDSGDVSIRDTLGESTKEVCRLILFTALFLIALRVYSWKDHRPLGALVLLMARCLAIVSAIEAVRIAQIPHGISRLLLISIAQYVIFVIGVFALFSFRLKESIVFATSCSVGVALIWLGTQISSWLI